MSNYTKREIRYGRFFAGLATGIVIFVVAEVILRWFW